MSLKSDAQEVEKVEQEVKAAVVGLPNPTFATAFKATLGFYAAQFVATLTGLAVLGGGLLIFLFLIKHLFF